MNVSNPADTNRLEHMMSLHNLGLCYTRGRGLIPRAENKFWALKDVSFDVKRGETLGLVGRNGSGKSTLLKVMAGIIRPNKGTLVNRSAHVSLLSIQAGFDVYLSGRRNVIISGMLLGLSRRQIMGKVDDIIELAGLHDFIDEPVRSYSTGMRARLGFSTAYHIDPDVLLVDEILGVGDAKFSEKAVELLRTKFSTDKTAVVVTHSEHRLKELCDRVVWIEDGAVYMIGSAEEVWKEYRIFYRAWKGLSVRPEDKAKADQFKSK